jgi:hypothetical protein
LPAELAESKKSFTCCHAKHGGCLMSRNKKTANSAVPGIGANAPLDSQLVRALVRSKRFLAADRADLSLAEIKTWDPHLLREHRLLVPMDVQALYVAPGSAEKMVRLPLLVAGAAGAPDAAAGMPAPFEAGSPRPPGVHLHWAMPDALLRGRLSAGAAGRRNVLGLPPLPDRFVVLRLLQPRGAKEVLQSGWVLEADRAVAVPLAQWSEGSAASQTAAAAGLTVPREQLTGTVGGDVSWSAVYDAVLNRFAFHDPLSDVAALAPQGVDEDCASYVVAGWWSDPSLDPLDRARSADSLAELLGRLRWSQLYEWGDARWAEQEARAQAELRRSLGLAEGQRFGAARVVAAPGRKGFESTSAHAAASVSSRAAAASQGFTPIDRSVVTHETLALHSVFASAAAQRVVAPPWHLRSCLLHGAVYGVPVAGTSPVDLRPNAADVALAFGLHDDDLLAAFAAEHATPNQRRATERLLAAFTSQKVNRLGSADGLVEIEEYEHGAGFTSLPGGSAGTDRFLQRVQTGGVGGLKLGRNMASEIKANAFVGAAAAKSRAPAGASPAASLSFSTSARPTLVQASVVQIDDLARSRVGEVLTPTEARVLDRPAPRFAFPTEPLVAVRGASRSLRLGGDGRANSDATLTCRWPTHVIQAVEGVIEPSRFITTLGNGSVPSEALALAREALLLDPYHDDWVAAAVTPPGKPVATVLGRLKAESALRFGADGTYDGATQLLSGQALRGAPRARAMATPQGRAAVTRATSAERLMQVHLADEFRRFSLYKGAEPSLVGVTAWAQPWVPMWLEWEVQMEGIDPGHLDAWRLGSLDLERAEASTPAGSRTLRGRSTLTTGAAVTLHSAITDWLRAEDQLDAVQAGLVDETTEQAYRDLDAAVKHLDVVTASLDGLRTQLLGFVAQDGLRRRPDGTGGTLPPAPAAAPQSLWAGSVRLLRARLLDAFGRTLDLPVDAVITPSRQSAAADGAAVPGALAFGPRLLRPARWLFRWVEAGTPVGAEGSEARIDQIEAALQVNPVAGFVMPDHLDESLEVFGVDGAPIGELLHEPVSGGVMWEIAAGREGPADAGPHFGLTPSQAALANFAAGVVAADAHARQGLPLDQARPAESALSALLRAIDTTLWSVDSFAALGSEHVAGLVGRPLAVVRAQLRLELKPPDDVDLSDPARAAEWAAAEQAAKAYAFPVRIGEITRSDDGVLGFFVNDDYAHFRLVDKVIAATAVESGRGRGHLGLLGAVSGMPAASAIDHPYIAGTDDADTLALHIGQSVTLTILMHPAGKCTLTSGILPRKALALARDWVAPGLAKIAPSLRTGPVLVETDLDTEHQVRLPKVSVFGKDQNFLWRDTPSTWRTDAILAATQSALLPDTPAQLREGWIRVAPDTPPADAAGPAPGAAP